MREGKEEKTTREGVREREKKKLNARLAIR